MFDDFEGLSASRLTDSKSALVVAHYQRAVPHTMAAVDVLTTRGEHHTYIGLTENAVLWLAHRGAVGMLSWTPSLRDPGCVGYARAFCCGGPTRRRKKT